MEKSGGERKIIVSRVLRTFGVGESYLADEVEDILTSSTNPTVAPLNFWQYRSSSAPDRQSPRRTTRRRDLLDEMEDRVRARVGQYIFGRDDQHLPQVLVDMLSARASTVAVAESLTGGWLGSSLTEATGCSAVFLGGVVAYSPFIKAEVLGVSEADVEKYSVVSEQIAAQMATGVQKAMNSTYGLSTTGEAGPDPATDNPVGTVFIGLAHPGGVEVVKKQFHGDRETIRKRAALSAIDLLRRWVLEHNA